MSNIILKTKMLSKTFSNGGRQQHVLRNLNLDIQEGDFTVIMGASGSGKSTLLFALSGMDKPSLGEIIFDGQDISKYSNDKLAVFRRKNCGFVFQQIYLLNTMSVLDNCLASGLLISKSKRKVSEKAKEYLLLVGLNEADWNKFPSQLSGGEAQRAGIVRALMNDPKVVFADEPTGALNSAAGNDVLELLTNINKKGQSILMVTHDMKSAIRGNRIVYLKDGIICGECHLGAYTSSDIGRHDKLTLFLSEMGW